MEPRQSVFAACIMTGGPDVAPAVTSFVALEVVERLCATFRQRPVVSVVRVETVVHMPIEPMRTMEPRTGSDKDAPNEPVRPIVPIRRAIIRRIVEVPIRTHRRHANANRNL